MVRRLPPLNALRAFECAARLGSFARAAEELSVTPAAVSHQVKGLEEFLGVELFVRLPRGLRLTDAGRAYLPDLSCGFDQLARAGTRITDRGCKGHLTVSIVPSLARRWLLPRLGEFRRDCPEIDISLHVTQDMADFLHDGVDVGVRYGSGVYPGLRAEWVMDSELFPVCSPTLLNGPHPLRTWDDLRRHTLIHHGRTEMLPDTWIAWRPWLTRAGLREGDCRGQLMVHDGSMSLEMAVDGLGVAIGRTALVSDDLREGRLVEPFGDRRDAEFSYYVVAPEARCDEPKVRAFMDWIKAQGMAWAAAQRRDGGGRREGAAPARPAPAPASAPASAEG